MVSHHSCAFDYHIVTPGRFELTVTAVKGQCHSPLDQGAKKTASYNEVFSGATVLSDLHSLHSLSAVHLRDGLLWYRILLLRCSNDFNGIRTRVIPAKQAGAIIH